MSGRGGKRRQVLQLGSASKLHRYGYSKGFHTTDKKGKGSRPVLVGNYSNSDSEDSEEAEEHTASDMKEEEETVASDTPDISVKMEQPADMDDELKNFLSEIEAIPAAPEMDSTEQSPVPMEDAKSEQEKIVEADLDVQSPGEAALDTQKPVSKSKPSSHHYSMFVKGESEFVHSPKLEAEEVKSPAAAKEEDLADEPTTNWQMVKDDNTDYYYYWNTATNEVTWEIPTEYTQYLLLHREYEEKVAKYTPEQLQKLKEKHAKVAGNDSGDADKSTDFHKGLDGRLSKATAKLPEGGLKDTTRSRSVSPRPEVGQDSKHQKHRKDKKSHHKKKHKRRHEDSQSDEDKPSPKVPESKKPAVISTETSTVTILAGGRLTSIVPYLSDQDDSDEDNNLDPMPLLASVALAVTDSQDQDRDGTPISDKSIDEDPPQLELFSTALQDSQAETAEVSLQLGSTQATDSDLSSLVLLSPPPPPPPPPPKEETLAGKDQTEEDDSELKKNKTHQFDQPLTDSATDLSTYQADIDSDRHMIESERHIIDSASPAIESQFNEVEVNEIIGAILDPVSAKGAADEALSPSVTESTVEAADEALSPSVTESTVEAADEALFPSVTESTVEVAQPVKEPVKIRQKEVIDMFAEDFPMPVSTQIKDVAPVDKSGDVVDDHVKKDLVATVEVMEDGETLEKDAHVLLGVEGIGCATSENGSDKKSKTHESSFVKSKSEGNGLEKGSKSSENRVEKRIKTSEKSAEKRNKAQESSLEKREKVPEQILDKKSQPRDNSLEKSRSKTRENSLENNKVKTSDKDGNRTQENSSQKNRSKTQENSSEKSRGRTQENSSEKSRSKAQENSSEKSRTKTRENSSEKSRSKPQENSPDKNRSKLYENSSDKGRNYTKENSSEKSRHKRENKSEKIRSKLQESSSEKSKKKARENRSEDRINLAEQATLKSVNIVGYASDDEEEEGEVREAVIKKTDKPTHIKQKDKRESKKHRNDSKAPLSSSADKKLESELVSIVPVPLMEVTSEAVAKPVGKPEKVCDDADDDIDFDIDDIDRALEVALEKKLEQKKILLQSMADAGDTTVRGDTISSMTSGAPLPGQILSTSYGTQIQAPDNGLQTSGEPSSVADSLKKFASEAKVEESAAPEDEKLVADIRCMAELALSKLEFLDISTENLSRLQVLFIELQTRFTDWASGGLSTQYFHEQLKTSEHLLEQYELSAVPDGWALQWDRYAALDFHWLSDNRMYGPGIDVAF